MEGQADTGSYCERLEGGSRPGKNCKGLFLGSSVKNVLGLRPTKGVGSLVAGLIRSTELELVSMISSGSEEPSIFWTSGDNR